MRLVCTTLVVLLLALGVSVQGAKRAAAQWKILTYDENGRLKDVRAEDGRERKAPSKTKPAQQDTAPAAARSRQETRFASGEIIVSDPPEGFVSTLRQLGFTVIDRLSLRSLSIQVLRLRVPKGSTVPAAVTRLRRRFPGLRIDANHLLVVSGASRNPEAYARAVMGWGVPPTGCGRGVKIGVVDGAVDVGHPALVGQDVVYRSFNAPDRRPAAVEHGTAIAAMMVGRAQWGGLLPAASLKHANIFEMDDAGKVSANVYALLKAMDWMVGERVHVINLSVAGSSNQVLQYVLDQTRAHGIISVAAAGNGGIDAEPAYPAAYANVIAVTAVDVGQGIYTYANRGGYIDFAAPGVGIWTAVPGGGRAQSGTSFAAPYVSVLTALAVAHGRARSAAQARARLRAQTLDLGAPGRDPVFGWGLVKLGRDCRPQTAG